MVSYVGVLLELPTLQRKIHAGNHIFIFKKVSHSIYLLTIHCHHPVTTLSTYTTICLIYTLIHSHSAFLMRRTASSSGSHRELRKEPEVGHRKTIYHHPFDCMVLTRRFWMILQSKRFTSRFLPSSTWNGVRYHHHPNPPHKPNLTHYHTLTLR